MNLYASASVGDGSESVSVELTGAADAIKSNVPFAAYMIFGHGGFRVAKRTEIAAINPDASVGRLRADYSAALGADECVGQTFSYFGLSSDGETLVCRCDFTPETKSGGKPFRVSVTVFADFADGSDKVLCGGDNPVARLLLGACAVSCKAEAAEGGCDMPDAFLRTEPPLSGRVPAEISFGADGMEISAEVGAAAKDVTVFIDGAPSLRAFLRGKAPETRMFPSLTVGEDRCVPLDAADVESVFACESGGINHPAFRLVRGTEKVTEVFGFLPFSVGRGAIIKTDEICECAAVANEREIMLVRLEEGRLICDFSVPRGDGEDFAACAGGYLAVIGDTVRIFGPNGTEEEYAVSGGEQNVIVRDGNLFHFACLTGNVVKRFALSDGTAEELPEIAAADDAKLFGCMFRIGIASKQKSYIIDVHDGKDADIESRRNAYLELFCEIAGSARNVDFGGSLMTARRSYAVSVIADLYTRAETVYPTGEKAWLFGDYVVLSDGTVKEFCRAANSVRDVAGMPELTEGCSMGRIGDFLLAADSDGRARIFYCNRSRGYLYCPSARAGDKLTVGAYVRSDPFEDCEKVRAVFRVKI